MKIYREFTDDYKHDGSRPIWERANPAEALTHRMDGRIKECRDALLLEINRQEEIRADLDAAGRINDPAVREAVMATITRSISGESIADVIDKCIIVPTFDDESGKEA